MPTRQRIINSLANGDSIRAIARALAVSVNTVSAIARQEWIQVETRKQRLAAQWEQAATSAVDQLNEHLETSTLPPNVLVPIAGVATDKLIALRGDSALTIRHEHFHRLCDDDIIAFAVARSQRRKAIDAEIVTNKPVGEDARETHLLAEKTPRKKKRR